MGTFVKIWAQVLKSPALPCPNLLKKRKRNSMSLRRILLVTLEVGFAVGRAGTGAEAHTNY